MSASDKSTSRRLAELETQRFGELTDKRAALAEFADEGMLMPLRRAAIAEAVPAFAQASVDRYRTRIPLVPLLDPRAPLVDVLRVVLICCLSAMAVGASFAIGFKYVWAAPPPQSDVIETFPLRPFSHASFVVPYRQAVESERPTAGRIGNESMPTAPDSMDRARATASASKEQGSRIEPNRSKGGLRWLRRTMGAVD